MGMEKTLEQYLARQMEVFNEVKRVLRVDGVVWVLIDDALSQHSYRYQVASYNNGGQPKAKWRTQTEVITQDTTYLAPAGDWLGIPDAFGKAMQANGWRWREHIIWAKDASGRKESTFSRCRHNYEHLLMFTKGMNYY